MPLDYSPNIAAAVLSEARRHPSLGPLLAEEAGADGVTSALLETARAEIQLPTQRVHEDRRGAATAVLSAYERSFAHDKHLRLRDPRDPGRPGAVTPPSRPCEHRRGAFPQPSTVADLHNQMGPARPLEIRRSAALRLARRLRLVA